ncbi:hypothetical protein BDQ17DRAFT_345056 [Cyathus striatus]|nr:hypothetical protein BDQ17DRAFT_345056 [Cyathus striatus]
MKKTIPVRNIREWYSSSMPLQAFPLETAVANFRNVFGSICYSSNYDFCRGSSGPAPYGVAGRCRRAALVLFLTPYSSRGSPIHLLYCRNITIKKQVQGLMNLRCDMGARNHGKSNASVLSCSYYITRLCRCTSCLWQKCMFCSSPFLWWFVKHIVYFSSADISFYVLIKPNSNSIKYSTSIPSTYIANLTCSRYRNSCLSV